ncbi:hypothetical protein COCON_G00004750 [Conger conger]|uniref:Uncharacterized protein n=1 Tax=Conger conger TaxID=82655 RepID=A0A9Q1E1B4_CONCO|nr:hypothetical protein COCON_G00004750 [Conger conger]
MDTKPVARDNEGEKGQGESRAKGPDIVGEPERSVIEIKGNGLYFDSVDFLQLLRLLRISLPEGIMSDRVIEISKTEQSVKYAETLIQDLETFKLVFMKSPRLASRKVKHALALKEHGKVLDLTRLIFFENKKNGEEEIQKQWEKNTSNTGHGFKLRESYMTTPISTPLMYSTAMTRTLKTPQAGTDSPRVTPGTRVKTGDIEKMEFVNEAELWNGESSAKGFGRNTADEAESLKFFLGLQDDIVDYKKARYTKGNVIEYGFLKGRLDFLAEVNNGQEVSKRLVIECKSTEGDEFYTKIPDSQKATIKDLDHMYYIQVQTYLYLLEELAKKETSHPDTRGVMIFRHYHEDCEPPRDFHWTYLETDRELQDQIKSLRVFCKEDVLGCFLAVLNLVFQKEKISQLGTSENVSESKHEL